MRGAILATAIFGWSASLGLAFAEVPAAPRPSDGSRPLAMERTKQRTHQAAIGDCERTWDRGTHMSKRDWSQTCRRVQDRLRQLGLR
jgi:hypothetical protein